VKHFSDLRIGKTTSFEKLDLLGLFDFFNVFQKQSGENP